MKICYRPKRFRLETLKLIELADSICAEYVADGLNLTLRQLYYQFVARDIIPNNMKSYNRLKKTVNEGRLAGLLDWEAIVDRTRNLQTPASWDSPESIIDVCARQYRRDLWENQGTKVQVWVEKDALIGVIQRAAAKFRLPYFSCRGYVSQSEIWQHARNLMGEGDVVILHLGDHDPSGVDMTRDMQERFNLFEAGNVRFERIALTMDQIDELKPPPNPAKITDTRATGYIEKFGKESWELDALQPKYIVDLVNEAAGKHIDHKQWKIDLAMEESERNTLEGISYDYDEVCEFLRKKNDDEED